MFNIKQQQVIDELDHNILLSAGAGTGKTNVLSHRVANILEHHKAAADEILCLTFTNKACRELKNRITSQIDFAQAQAITIRTIHGFAYQMIASAAKSQEHTFKEFTIFDDEDQLALIKQITYNNPRFQNATNRDFQYLRDCIESLKQERALLLLYTDIADDYERIYHRHLQFNKTFNQQASDNLAKFFELGGLNIIIKYEKELKQMRSLDYKDLIANAYRLLQDENFRQTWQAKYKYIMIDEMQDTSDFEYTMLEKLFARNNIMLCGDEFQTIYGWRGSNPKHILSQFCQKYTPTIINFTENYRSTKILLEMAYNALLNLFHKDVIEHSYANNMIAKSSEVGHKIKCKQALSPREEAFWIFEQILKLLPYSTPSDFAILVRQNKYINTLVTILNKLADKYNKQNPQQPINFIQIDTIKFFKRQEIKDILAIFKYLINQNDYLSLRRILIRLVPNIGVKTIEQISSENYLNAGIRLSDLLNANLSKSTYDPFAPLIQAYFHQDIIVFDIEGTGTDVFTDNIVQLSAVRVRGGKVIATFDKYLQSEKSVGTSEKVHHISDDFLAKNGEKPTKVLTEFATFIQDAIITGHNIRGYDMDMLNQNLLRRKLPTIDFTHINFDTLDLARRFYPNLPNHKLEFLSCHFNLETKSNHNSLDDVKTTWNLLALLLKDKIIPTTPVRIALIQKQQAKFLAIANIFTQLRQELSENIVITKIISSIVDKFKLKKIYRAETDEGSKRLENLRNLYRIVQQDGDMQTGINGLKELLQYATLSNSDLDAITAKQPKIPIITIHQAKGLEFKYEFLAGMNDEIFPSYFSVQNGYVTDEEKRLFYVAITRAKKELYISWFGKKSRLLKAISPQFISEE